MRLRICITCGYSHFKIYKKRKKVILEQVSLNELIR